MRRSAIVLAVLAALTMVIAGPAASAGTPGFRILHQFKGPDGTEPTFLVRGADGNLYGTALVGGVGAQGVGNGTLYRIDPGTGAFTLIHAFQGTPDGSLPGRLVPASDGSIYVVVASGGAFSQGAIMRLDLADGTLSILHSFTGGADGAGPGYLTEVSPGVFYGTTGGGGTPPAGCHLPPQGVVYRMDVEGTVTPLHTFCENIDGSGPNSIVAMPGGDFIGTAREDGPLPGGAFGVGTVWRMAPSGDVTVLHVFTGNSVAVHDAAEPGSLVRGPDGLYYGVGNQGGEFSQGAIFRTDEAGTIEIVHHFNDFGSDGTDPGGLILGADGFLYGNTAGGGLPVGVFDTHQGVVYRFDTAGHLWVLHSFDYDHGSSPAVPAFGGDGSLYGNTLFGGTSLAPKGVTYQLALRKSLPISSLELTPGLISAGQRALGELRLKAPAPAGGQVVQLFATNSLSIPKSVTVPAGERTVAFTVRSQTGTASFVATITAYIDTLGESAPLRVAA